MCEKSNQLKFCTCLEASDIETINFQKSLDKFQKKQLPNADEPYTWVLYTYKGSEDTGMMGMLHMPSDKIGHGLSEAFVCNELNHKNCFDFDYKPIEGDNLQINFQKDADSTEFLSFIFRNNTWEPDIYYTFTEIIEPVNYGILKVDR